MAGLMSGTLHQFHFRLGVPSATDLSVAGSPHDSALRTPPLIECQSLRTLKKPICVQAGSAVSRRSLHFGSGICAASSSTVEPEVIQSTAGLKPTTLYDVLGISDKVSDEEIKAAFRRIAKEVHPDQARPDQVNEYQKKFMEVHKAYSVLKDPRTRSLYNYEIRNSLYSKRIQAADWKRPVWRGCNWETDQCWTL